MEAQRSEQIIGSHFRPSGASGRLRLGRACVGSEAEAVLRVFPVSENLAGRAFPVPVSTKNSLPINTFRPMAHSLLRHAVKCLIS